MSVCPAHGDGWLSCFVDIHLGAVLRLFLEISDSDAHEEFHHPDREALRHLHHARGPDRRQLRDG